MAAFAAPRLVVSTPALAPESKIDLVLDLPAIESLEVGKTVPNTWLEINPQTTQLLGETQLAAAAGTATLTIAIPPSRFSDPARGRSVHRSH